MAPFAEPATFRLLGGITCDHEPLDEFRKRHAGLGQDGSEAVCGAGGGWRRTGDARPTTVNAATRADAARCGGRA